MTTALHVTNVTKRYGELSVLANVNLRVELGERRAVLGPNGAGKTTLFHLISGMQSTTSGSVSLFGHDITHMPPQKRARLGLARTFQRNNLFPNLTVLESVRLAVQARAADSWHIWRPARSESAMLATVEELIDRLGLAHASHQLTTALSYGEQRQLDLALALACRPRVLLLDEPTAGMSPAETTAIVSLLATLPPDTSLILIEHDMTVVGALANQITILHHGTVIADGPADAVRNDRRVQEVYLGEEPGADA